MVHEVTLEELIYTVLPKDKDNNFIKENIKISFERIHFIINTVEKEHPSIVFDYDDFSLYYFENKFKNLAKDYINVTGEYVELLIGENESIIDIIKRYKPTNEDENIISDVSNRWDSIQSRNLKSIKLEFTIDDLRNFALKCKMPKMSFRFINEVRETCRINGLLVDLSKKDFDTYKYDYPNNIDLNYDDNFVEFK